MGLAVQGRKCARSSRGPWQRIRLTLVLLALALGTRSTPSTALLARAPRPLQCPSACGDNAVTDARHRPPQPRLPLAPPCSASRPASPSAPFAASSAPPSSTTRPSRDCCALPASSAAPPPSRPSTPSRCSAPWAYEDGCCQLLWRRGLYYYCSSRCRRPCPWHHCCIAPSSSSLGLGVFLEGGLSLPAFIHVSCTTISSSSEYNSTAAVLAVHFAATAEDEYLKGCRGNTRRVLFVCENFAVVAFRDIQHSTTTNL